MSTANRSHHDSFVSSKLSKHLFENIPCDITSQKAAKIKLATPLHMAFPALKTWIARKFPQSRTLDSRNNGVRTPSTFS